MLMETESRIVSGYKTNGISENTNNDICFNSVTFNYGTQENILEKLDFKVDSGSFCSLVGTSGSGKSTIINLLIRLWLPQNGLIKIAGEKIEEYDIKYLRNQIGIVSQNIVLINGSILDNISLGRQYTIEEVDAVIDICGLKDFVTSLSEGIYTQIGDNGIKISGGQKQRMQIARMLLKKTPILILDEATSALDGVIENQIISRIKEAYKNTTILLITHRLWSLEDCDKIYVLDRGVIAEEGEYNELIKRNGIFKKMYDVQKKEDKSNKEQYN